MSDPFDFAEPDDVDPVTAAPAEPPHLAGLNPEQRAAVEALDGPVLVLAGAGTGKTRVLTARLAQVLWTRSAWPSQILAVTFTNKAAREMQDRVAAMVGRAVEGLWLGTFHSIGVRLLRRHAELVGLQQGFTILDTDDQLRLVKQVMEAAELDTKRWPPRALLALIQRWKDRGLTPDKAPADEAGGFAGGRAVAIYRAYQERLQVVNACDFGDLLMHALGLLQNNPDIARRYQEQFRYILVDEYQDTNVVQYLLLRLLAQQHRNICCVGDDDQSIYSWRGAEVGNILRFEADFPGAKVIRLERNYRSTPHILGAASRLIAHNESRLGKTLWTDLNQGEQVEVRGVWDGEEEARFVGDEVEAMQRRGESLDQAAILVRATHQTRAFEERFINLGVPYRLIGGARFYERAEVRDAIAYARVIAQPADDLAFERILNRPKRGLGDTTLKALHTAGRLSGIPLAAAAASMLGTDELRPKARRTVADLLQSFDRWRLLVQQRPLPEAMAVVLDESGYTQMWQEERTPDAAGRLENLKEFVRALADFESLEGFLEHVSLVAENANQAKDGAAVSIMTLHGAKGLEFDTVFLPGWEEELFPNKRALEEGGVAALEEERRLAYVGLTRARRRAVVSFAANRRLFDRWVVGLPSRFVAELPEEHVVRDAAPGLADGGPMPGGFAYDAYEPAATSRMRRLDRPRSPHVLDLQPESRITSNPDETRFSAGERVFHDKFGYGRILRVEGNKLDVAFDKAGTKKVIDSFVKQA